MRGKVEYSSPNIGPTLLSLFWLLSGACLVLQCSDPCHFLVAGSALLKITDNLTVPAVPPGFSREVDPVFQVGNFLRYMLLQFRALVFWPASRNGRWTRLKRWIDWG